MKAVIFAYSRQGIRTAERIEAFFHGSEIRKFAPDRFSQEGFGRLPKGGRNFYGEQFSWADALIFISSCGIAVREIAPHIRSKTTDPAVLCIDELGHYIIPLLSGHIGGANALARQLSKAVNAVPVITTATDINGRFSVDSWAAANGFIIGSMERAKEISAAILERDLPLCSALPVMTELPDGIYSGEQGELGIYIGWEKRDPFEKTLHLIPPVLHLGIGCRKGVRAEDIRDAVSAALTKENIDARAVKCAASIDLKAEEHGLLEYCRSANLPVRFYTAEELSAIPGDFTGSEFVKSITGVDNICERAAMIGAQKIILKKTAGKGITIAIAAERKEVRFA